MARFASRSTLSHPANAGQVGPAVDPIDIPVVIGVSSERFSEWITFSWGMSVKLPCERAALDAWWHNVSMRRPHPAGERHQTVCEVLK